MREEWLNHDFCQVQLLAVYFPPTAYPSLSFSARHFVLLILGGKRKGNRIRPCGVHLVAGCIFKVVMFSVHSLVSSNRTVSVALLSQT